MWLRVHSSEFVESYLIFMSMPFVMRLLLAMCDGTYNFLRLFDLLIDAIFSNDLTISVECKLFLHHTSFFPILWVCVPYLRTLWDISFSWKKLDEKCDLSWSITYNPHDLWFFSIDNLGKKLVGGVVKREGKSRRIGKSPLTHNLYKKWRSHRGSTP